MQDIDKRFSYKKTSFLGVVIIFLVFGILGVWAVFAKMDLSVQAPGNVIVQSYKKTIKHTKGGIVHKIYVKEGDFVKQGDLLIELDTRQLHSQLESAKSEYQHLLAEKIRIEAELKNSKDVKFSHSIDESIKKEELEILHNRKRNLDEKLQNLKYQIEEQKSSINALKATSKAKEKILLTFKNELKEWEKLYRKGMADRLKLFELERQITQLEGEIKNINAQIVQKEANILELENRLQLTKSEYKKELLERLKAINVKLPSLKSKIAILKDEIEKSKIVSPSDGVVVDMSVHTPGEVITPHKPIMYIVPKSDKLIIEAQIDPKDIDKVKVGEKAEINFASYVNPSAKPVYGKVIYVSADIIKDERDPRIQYYKALIEITPEGLKAIKENGFQVVPGMPVTVFIKAGQRSFLSYILMPIEQLLKGAFYAN